MCHVLGVFKLGYKHGKFSVILILLSIDRVNVMTIITSKMLPPSDIKISTTSGIYNVLFIKHKRLV